MGKHELELTCKIKGALFNQILEGKRDNRQSSFIQLDLKKKLPMKLIFTT